MRKQQYQMLAGTGGARSRCAWCASQAGPLITAGTGGIRKGHGKSVAPVSGTLAACCASGGCWPVSPWQCLMHRADAPESASTGLEPASVPESGPAIMCSQGGPAMDASARPRAPASAGQAWAAVAICANSKAAAKPSQRRRRHALTMRMARA